MKVSVRCVAYCVSLKDSSPLDMYSSLDGSLDKPAQDFQGHVLYYAHGKYMRKLFFKNAQCIILRCIAYSGSFCPE